MAITFTPADLDALRRIADSQFTSNPSKAEINAAIQAIQNWLEGGFAVTPTNSLSAAITASSAHVFTAAEKKLLVKVWLLGLYNKGGF